MALKGALGVGILGGGAVTQAIHLPTLAVLGDEFRVVHISDPDLSLAQAVTAPLAARASASIDELLADDEVDVVAICSPHALHVPHAVAALSAQKAVICEKPLALDRAGLGDLRAASRTATRPMLAGWMHAFDPAALTALAAWRDRGERAHSVRVSAVLPGNTHFTNIATEMHPPSAAPQARTSPPLDPRSALREGLLTLAIHDLPLVRRLLTASASEWDITVNFAAWQSPWGYLVLAEVDGVRVELHASFGQPWKAAWTLEAISPDARLRIDFPPSYVHAGSATASFTSSTGDLTWRPSTEDGYHREWLRVAHAMRDGDSGVLDDALADAEFALSIADAVFDADTLHMAS